MRNRGKGFFTSLTQLRIPMKPPGSATRVSRRPGSPAPEFKGVVGWPPNYFASLPVLPHPTVGTHTIHPEGEY
jgi:hypothetical protein